MQHGLIDADELKGVMPFLGEEASQEEIAALFYEAGHTMPPH